ncbi:heavy metal-associated domain-containing protein [uncultured Flavobacterium sp.]|uniref:heavy-metal-associated domain-containing protein n=1 Tax=uncultured Flavobacterium sp. TaxID=165435 RepID=UPI0030EF2B8C|tara:strand:- start:1130 stop:1609 length:480 start_codon:yes stop_codon:yes gene_type:complete
MKNILFTLCTLLLALQTNAQIVKAEIIATGLTCSMCSNAINKQLKSLPEVESVETDLNTNTFTVIMKAGANTNPNLFKENVEKAGFFVGSLVLTVDSRTLKNYINIDENEIPGTNEFQIQVLDKGFVTDKEFKKLSKKYKNSETYLVNNDDDFHFKILN